MFIQMVQGTCTREDEMHSLVDSWCATMSERPGWLGGTYGFTDDSRFVGVVRYDSETSCRENCSREDAGAWWAQAEMLFDGAPEIHQSEDVSMMLDGGSDDAGFVQVMRGRVLDADRFRHFNTDTEMTNMLHQARPEIIGSTLLFEPDGTFTETISFTDEATARVGEKQEMPAEMMTDWQSSIADVEYIDLHRPWFATHK
ncbi:hypothetical protein [Nocardioides speluncae]|uniref:hypothetical protein n=1 Tax=Nocardioides speluncae TaxID=2670337 RepID=UPI000D68A1E0|nr:hypothetical protein [Nocardioides speluncae]